MIITKKVPHSYDVRRYVALNIPVETHVKFKALKERTGHSIARLVQLACEEFLKNVKVEQ